MTCTACGDTPKHACGCKDCTKAVLEITNPEKIILLRKVVIPASMGDDTTVPAALGKYCNVILYYEANKHVYLYSSDGIPTLLETEVPQEVLDRVTELEEGLVDESETRAAADEQLSEAIADESTAREAADAAEAAARTQAISDETSARTTADATLQSNIDAVASNLATEASTREAADTALGTRIDGVVSDLATETSNRQSADTTLQSNIDAEETARTNADATLQTNIDNLSTALTTETTNRTNADTALGTRIDGVAGDLATETTNRQTADAGLQSQIDAIVVSSDVKDIVGTYAALQQYDTSTLGDNDIIKVLQDETHSGETTYYRWSTTTSAFTLIGEEGPYYTKSATDTLLNAKADKATTYTKTEVDTALATKQDTLTAGANVQINNNIVSATNTTYTDFTGTDGTTAGTSGLVPAPATTDAGKFLKADGTWDTAGSTINVVQTTGTSTTDVMSQIATSQMIYPSGYETSKNRIAIGANATSESDGSIAIGSNARGGNRSHSDVVIGSSAYAYNGDFNVAIGAGATTTSNSSYAISIGAYANDSSLAAAPHSIALGDYSKTTQKGQMDISTMASTNTYGYNNSQYRLLTGLYDPQSAHDAATKGYVDANAGGQTLTNAEFNTLFGTNLTEEA